MLSTASSIRSVLNWLESVYSIHIEILTYPITTPILYRWTARKNNRLVTDEEVPKSIKCEVRGTDGNYAIYYYGLNDAAKQAIKYCLVNLI